MDAYRGGESFGVCCSGLRYWNLIVFARPRSRYVTTGIAAPILLAKQGGREVHAMPAFDDEDRPKKKVTHEIGQDLTLLSVGELTERVALLKEEIARLEANMSSKRASKSAADLFFKK
jgi:uncharacterized small protein (DUF1192 family)